MDPLSLILVLWLSCVFVAISLIVLAAEWVKVRERRKVEQRIAELEKEKSSS